MVTGLSQGIGMKMSFQSFDIITVLFMEAKKCKQNDFICRSLGQFYLGRKILIKDWQR